MLTKIVIESFKSLEHVEVELGLVNVFVGANGSGKSNLLEAIGVLSAAAAGRVDDEALMRRGVRPGVPKLYKCALKNNAENARRAPHLFFSAENKQSKYEVSLLNPLEDPKPAWRYKSESWESNGVKIFGRSHAMKDKSNPEAGMAALKAVERKPGDAALALLDLLREYAIYEPNTPTLRGLAVESRPREPIGLSGGGLPLAILHLLKSRKSNDEAQDRFRQFSRLIDWSKSVGSCPAHLMPLSPSAATSRQVIRFVDRYMMEARNTLSGADASEGALYILFAAVMTLHETAPKLCAIDNVDHGLNPRLAKALTQVVCKTVLTSSPERQLLLTSHSPQVLDGLPLQDERVRLFTVSRTNTGRTVVRRIEVSEKLMKMAQEGWTLSRLWVMGHLGGVPNV